MKTFKSVILVKYPQDLVWQSIRDRLSEMVPYLDDVANITQEHRKEDDDGSLHLTNIWKADAKIPAMLHSIIDPDSISWTDRAQWIEEKNACHWAIEPHFFPDRTRCSGITYYEPAIGGRGTRITFTGELEVNAKNIPGLPGIVESTATKTIESLVTTLIPKNFRKVTAALSVLLDN